MTVEQLVSELTGENKVQAELGRRLIEALNASKESAERYSKSITYLTVVLVILTFALAMQG
jgi:hypothetical protein